MLKFLGTPDISRTKVKFQDFQGIYRSLVTMYYVNNLTFMTKIIFSTLSKMRKFKNKIENITESNFYQNKNEDIN